MTPKELLILNQAQSPIFQRMLEDAAAPTPAHFITGTPFPANLETTIVERGTPYDRRSLKHRGLSWVRFGLDAALKATTTRRPFLLANTNPPFLPQVAWLAAKTRGLGYGLLFWDIFPHHLVLQGMSSENSPLVKTWHWTNRHALRDADFVVTLGASMARALEEEADQALPRMHIIPNWADTDVIRPRLRADNPWAKRLNIREDDFVVLYSGNLGASHDFSVVLGAAAKLNSSKRFRFLIFGDGLGRQYLERELAAKPLSNFEIHEFVAWDELPYTLALADVAIVTQHAGAAALAVPSKTYSSLAAGSAIAAICAPTGDLADLVRSENAGFVCQDAEGFAAELNALWEDRGRLQTLKENARDAAVRDYSYDCVLQQWRAVIQQVLR